MVWVSLIMGTPKIVQKKKINFSEAELDLKISVFGLRHVTSFVSIIFNRKEISTSTWYSRAQLVKTNRMICNFTYFEPT